MKWVILLKSNETPEILRRNQEIQETKTKPFLLLIYAFEGNLIKKLKVMETYK